MKEQILKIADDLRNEEITTEYAQDLLLRLFSVVGRSEQLVCPVCKSKNIKQDKKWKDNECLNCKRIWAN